MIFFSYFITFPRSKQKIIYSCSYYIYNNRAILQHQQQRKDSSVSNQKSSSSSPFFQSFNERPPEVEVKPPERPKKFSDFYKRMPLFGYALKGDRNDCFVFAFSTLFN